VEIIAEVVIQVLGWILQLLGELLVQVVFEAIAELIGHGVRRPFERSEPVRPWLAALGYVLFGAAAGAISLWLLPDLFIEKGWLRWVNVIVTPIAAGGIMSAIGAWRRHRDMRVIRLDFFAYGYCFALAMAVVRLAWGR
jgi:hypothetical protein